MKNKFRIIASVLSLILVAGCMSACGNGGTENSESTKEASVVEEATTVAEISIDEAAAKEIALADAGINETAAENLTVKLENNAYVIAFVWSGFDYQYTVDATTGEITETIFDGDVL